MLTIYSKELNSFLNSLTGYVVILLFLVAMGLIVWVFPETSILSYGFATLNPLFTAGPFVYLFLVPAITMRSFAEEKSQGTMELLLTKPITDMSLILGKYLAGVTLVLISLLPTLVYFASVWHLGNPQGNIDVAGTVGSYLGLFMLGAVYTSIGILASSLTQNQIVAFILAVFFSFILYQGFASLATINVWGKASKIINELGLAYHYDALSRGLIDSRNILYFLSVIAVMLLSTRLVLGSRRW